MKKCKLCDNHNILKTHECGFSEGLIQLNENTLHIFDIKSKNFNKPNVKTNTEFFISINYCPMCGKQVNPNHTLIDDDCILCKKEKSIKVNNYQESNGLMSITPTQELDFWNGYPIPGSNNYKENQLKQGINLFTNIKYCPNCGKTLKNNSL